LACKKNHIQYFLVEGNHYEYDDYYLCHFLKKKARIGLLTGPACRVASTRPCVFHGEWNKSAPFNVMSIIEATYISVASPFGIVRLGRKNE